MTINKPIERKLKKKKIQRRKVTMTRFKQSMRGAKAQWITNFETEEVSIMLKSMTKNLRNGIIELGYEGYMYGLNNGLLKTAPCDDDNRYNRIFLTRKGYEIILQMKKSTCAFSGRRV